MHTHETTNQPTKWQQKLTRTNSKYNKYEKQIFWHLPQALGRGHHTWSEDWWCLAAMSLTSSVLLGTSRGGSSGQSPGYPRHRPFPHSCLSSAYIVCVCVSVYLFISLCVKCSVYCELCWIDGVLYVRFMYFLYVGFASCVIYVLCVPTLLECVIYGLCICYILYVCHVCAMCYIFFSLCVLYVIYVLFEYIVYVVFYAYSIWYLCVVCIPYYSVSCVSCGQEVYCIKCAVYGICDMCVHSYKSQDIV